MTINEIREILQLLLESGVAEMEVQRGENRVWIRRSASMASPPEVQMVAPGMPLSVPFAAPPPAPNPSPVAPASPAEESLPVIKSPIVGTFYESASPGAPPFVNVGDAVQPGQVLCIIESMKLMNEIEAEAAGVIAAKLVPNGKPVEYGEALFTYRPL